MKPIDIKLPERVLLEGDVMFVVLPTLDELEAFWTEHRDRFAYAVEGIALSTGQDYLNECEWVFAPSKAAVVKTVMRWDQLGIKCVWDDYTKARAGSTTRWWHMAAGRQTTIQNGKRTDEQERDHVERCPGAWKLINLPCGIEWHDWLSGLHDDIHDPNLPEAVVAQRYQEQTFNDWKESDVGDLKFHDVASLDEEIAYWRARQARGVAYYGLDAPT